MLKILPRPTGDGTAPHPASPIPNPATSGGRFLISRAGGLPAPRRREDADETREFPPNTAWWPAS